MSRIRLNAKDKNHTVICGLDHAIGWFFQLYDSSKEPNQNPVLDECLLFHNLGRSALIERIDQYAVKDARTDHCTTNIALDLDPAAGVVPSLEE